MTYPYKSLMRNNYAKNCSTVTDLNHVSWGIVTLVAPLLLSLRVVKVMFYRMVVTRNLEINFETG